MTIKPWLLALTVAGVMNIVPAGSFSAVAADFYKDKTITMTIGGSAGGGYDTLGRGIARFLKDHIPGNPTIIVKNLPGGGGVTAMNYLYKNAKKDGTEIGLIANNTPFEPLFGNKNAVYEATRFNWLGTPSFEVGMILVWHTVAANSVDDLKKNVITMGASGTRSSPAFFTRVLNETLGTKMKIIAGYEGLNAVFLAMERGEVDGSPSAFYSALKSTRPNWLKDHQAKVLLQFGPEPLKELGNAPFADDLVTNADDKKLLQAAIAPLALGRPLVMPPDVPADQVAILRKALADTFADPAFKAYADQTGLIVDTPRTGQQLQDAIQRTYTAPPHIIERMTKIMASD